VDGNGRGRTVLIVEDSEVIRRVLALILEAEGYRVIESADGRQVADLVRQQRPDVVTLDLSLPDVDGRDLLRKLGTDAALREVPVIVVSAFADTLNAAERWYAADVIVKPFDLDDLLVRLERAVARHRPREGNGTSRGY
jgi:DNA-binding response OmpR family regulator